MTVEAAKAALRSEMRARLGAMTDASRAASRDAIGRASLAAVASLTLAPRAVVGLFAPTPHEAGAPGLGAELRARGLVSAYPRVVPSPSGAVPGPLLPPALGFHVVGGEGDLVPGYRGIAEPLADSPVVPAEGLALVLVPGLAFDASGGRLGRGGGFYDRLLEGLPASVVRLGVAFARQIHPAPIPRAPHDALVDAVVTEGGLLATARWPLSGSRPKG